MVFQHFNPLRRSRFASVAHGKTRVALLVCLAIGGLTLLVSPLVVLSASSQNESAQNKETVTETVVRYANRWDPKQDPLLTLPNGVELKSSHVNGILIQGQRYYYRLRYGLNYDPVSRGDAVDYTTIAVLDPGTQWEMEIYRLPGGAVLAGQDSASLSSR